jgi:transcriptional regulator with XRE-family HTH domain
MSGTGATPRARQLGAEIHDAREEAGVGLRDLARKLRRSHTWLSHIESGRRPPSTEDVASILALIGITGPRRDDLLALARDAGDPNWVAPGVNRQLAALMGYEETADEITELNPLLVPGLLQTKRYCREIMNSAGETPGQADHLVGLRMGRREILVRTEPAPVHLVSLIAERALTEPTFAPHVMAEQMRHLATWGQLPNIEIRVIPTSVGWTPIHQGPVVLLRFERGRPVAHLERFRSTVMLTNPADVRDLQAAANSLRRAAMSPDESSGFIAELSHRWETNEGEFNRTAAMA